LPSGPQVKGFAVVVLDGVVVVLDGAVVVLIHPLVVLDGAVVVLQETTSGDTQLSVCGSNREVPGHVWM